MSARSTEMVKILLAGGADVNARNNQGEKGYEISWNIFIPAKIQLQIVIQIHKERGSESV